VVASISQINIIHYIWSFEQSKTFFKTFICFWKY